MICRNCPAAKRTLRNGHRCVMCIVYGMILQEEHRCDREGWKDYEPVTDHGEDGEDGTGIPEDGGGAA